MKIFWFAAILNNVGAFMDCSKGSDSAKSSLEFVVTPFFPRRTARVVQCKYTITCNFGDYIKLIPDIIEIPCNGDNGIYVQEKGGMAGPFCGKKHMPAFVSKDVTVDIYINIEAVIPANGARAKLGYKTVSKPAGPPIRGGRGLPDSLKSGLNRPDANSQTDPNLERNRQLQKSQDAMYEVENDPSEFRRMYDAKNANRWISETSNERVQPVNTFNRGRAYDDYGSRGLDSVLLSGSKDGQMAKMAVPVVVLMILVAIVVPIMHQRRQKMKQDLQKIQPEEKKAPAARPNYLDDLKKEPDFIPITPPETLQKKEEEAKQNSILSKKNAKSTDIIKVPPAPANTISNKNDSGIEKTEEQEHKPVKTISTESKDSQATTAPSMISEVKSETTTTIGVSVSGRPGRPRKSSQPKDEDRPSY
ncbi:Oidioi.mRNA.OKI2018_I69.PAR.g11624.t1.cds [Oikopleura dioica]|uniref:Oidioi.mRNA.OKI2018_I69.PAR.g11624.t1.cds n=1 Tax=Oikopleura dioica TaxID=34765 RepID=A0ABN7RWH7_OIKDI|nr:Oidioi.mRNA.OKI2018_I69.PAR.g11624.t1.cds [Oikopleura dioica]